MWHELNSQNDIDNFMKETAGFHDSCIVEMHYKSGNFVEESGAMCLATEPYMYITFHSKWQNFPRLKWNWVCWIDLQSILIWAIPWKFIMPHLKNGMTVFIGTVTSMRTKMRTTGSAAKPSAGEKSRWPINLMEAAPMVRKENSLCLLDLVCNAVLKPINGLNNIILY